MFEPAKLLLNKTLKNKVFKLTLAVEIVSDVKTRIFNTLKCEAFVYIR